MKTASPPIPSNEVLVAKFESLLAECDLIADYGILDNMEALFLDKGRKLLQETFEAKLQERIKTVETTSEAKQCPHCKKKRITKTRSRKP